MKKYFSFLIVFVCIFYILNFCNIKVNAVVNSDYSSIEVTEPGDNDDKDNNALDDFLGWIGSVVLEAIVKFIFAVARIIENLMTNFSSWLFGVKKFPWEDLIVFNSLPYLDINFFNPAAGSIFKSATGSTAIGDAIKSVYFSLLILSTSILGIGVAVTAIRLAISTIAAEKAKYKETISKCLYTVVLLFSAHILISFVFYLNESICVTASTVLKKLVNEQELDSLKKVDVEWTDEFIYANISAGYSSAELIDTDPFRYWVLDFGKHLGALTWDSGTLDKNYDLLSSKYNSLKGNSKFMQVVSYLASDSTYRTSRFWENDGNKHRTGYFTNGDKNTKSHKGNLMYMDIVNGKIEERATAGHIDSLPDAQAACGLLLKDAETIVQCSSKEELEKKYDGDTDKEYYKVIEKASSYYITHDWGLGNIISDLGDFFKNKANEIREGKFTQMVVTSVFLYSILLVQSIMILINYIKRLFYVTLLAILAPIVVIYDFFISAI